MPDQIKTTSVTVDIQDNGIIRLKRNGYLIGRLSDNLSIDSIIKLKRLSNETHNKELVNDEGEHDIDPP